MDDFRVRLDAHLKDPNRAVEDQEKTIECVAQSYGGGFADQIGF